MLDHLEESGDSMTVLEELFGESIDTDGVHADVLLSPASTEKHEEQPESDDRP